MTATMERKSGVPESNFGFLILGAGRGGTSLLAGMLDCHDRLEVGFEQFSVATLGGKELRSPKHEIFRHRVSRFLSACEREAERHGDVLWGNKITTEQVHHLEEHNLANPQARVDVLETLFNQYLKHVKVVFILRDGRACVESKVRRTGQPMAEAVWRWRYSVQCHRFFSERHANNFRLRFEDLLGDPRRTLTGVCDFLKIPFQESMLDGARNQKMPAEYRSDALDPSKARIPRLPDECLALMAEDLRYGGYL